MIVVRKKSMHSKHGLSKKSKNGQAPFIAPLQPSTLASFPPWGSSKGADRKRLAQHKGSKNSDFTKGNVFIFEYNDICLISNDMHFNFKRTLDEATAISFNNIYNST